MMYNAYEVFEIAEQIERNGGKFYRKAASIVDSEDAKEFLLELARMEDDHENYFGALKEKFALNAGNQEFPDLDNQTLTYLQEVAGGNVFVASNMQQDKIKGNETVEEIIKIAIDFEKDTIVFFSSVKECVPADFGQEKIDELIQEEIRHVGLLLNKLKNIS